MRIDLFCVLLVLPILSYAQHTTSMTLCADYSVNKTVLDPESRQNTIAMLNYSGHLFVDGKRAIFYKTPLFIKTYPEGKIEYERNTIGGRSFQVSIAERQGLSLIDLDSGIWRSRVDFGSSSGQNIMFQFELGFQQWQILPETKEVQGLKLQRAIWKNSKDIVQLDVWFCPEIPVLLGPFSTIGLPGLVVEGKRPTTGEEFTLIQYTLGCPIPKETFEPIEFTQPFTNRGLIRSGAK